MSQNYLFLPKCAFSAPYTDGINMFMQLHSNPTAIQ